MLLCCIFSRSGNENSPLLRRDNCRGVEAIVDASHCKPRIFKGFAENLDISICAVVQYMPRKEGYSARAPKRSRADMRIYGDTDNWRFRRREQRKVQTSYFTELVSSKRLIKIPTSPNWQIFSPKARKDRKVKPSTCSRLADWRCQCEPRAACRRNR